MGVIIEDIRFTNEYTAETTNYLLGNVGDKIAIEIDIRVEEVFVTEASIEIDRIMINVSPYRVNIPVTAGVIFCENSGTFAEYRVNDKVVIYDAGTMGFFAYFVIEKVDDEAIVVSNTLGGLPTDFTGNPLDTALPINSYIYLDTSLTAVTYKYNFVGNQDFASYLNPIDNQTNELYIGGVDNTDLVTQNTMLFSLPKTNDIGSAYVIGNGSSTTSQKFTIHHETIITPFHLAEELSNLRNGISPSYFDADNCLKHVFNVEIGRNLNDPNYIQQIDFAELDGNTGWFDENFNGNTNDYYVDSVVYKRLDTSIIDKIELTSTDQTIEIVIKNDTSPFVAGTEFVINHTILPEAVDDYTNNAKTITENFYFDRVFNTIGGGLVAGDNLGTEQQIIKDVSAVLTGADTMTITATISIDSIALADISSRADLEYLLWVGVEELGLTTETSDRVALKIDLQEYFTDFTDEGLFTIENKFLKHYETDVVSEGASTLVARTEDDILAYSLVYIDRLTRETDDILVTEMEASLVAKKSDGSEFTLEEFGQSFSGTQVIGDTQFISTTTERGFQMPTGEQRKEIKFNRREDLDTADLRYYEVYYPFLVRWEYWVALSGVNGDAHDITEEHNGQNEEWVRYDTLADWDFYFRLKATATKNGNVVTEIQDSLLTTADYLEDEDWSSETIKSFDVTSGLELTNGGSKLLSSPTRIEITKEYIGANILTLADVDWRMTIQVFEEGGITDARFLSSVYDWTEKSWFKSLDASNKVVKSLDGVIFKAEALIDFNVIPDSAKFTISGRIWDKIASLEVPCCLMTEDGGDILVEDELSCITSEDCGDEDFVGKTTEIGNAKLTESNLNKLID